MKGVMLGLLYMQAHLNGAMAEPLGSARPAVKMPLVVGEDAQCEVSEFAQLAIDGKCYPTAGESVRSSPALPASKSGLDDAASGVSAAKVEAGPGDSGRRHRRPTPLGLAGLSAHLRSEGARGAVVAEIHSSAGNARVNYEVFRGVLKRGFVRFMMETGAPNELLKDYEDGLERQDEEWMDKFIYDMAKTPEWRKWSAHMADGPQKMWDLLSRGGNFALQPVAYKWDGRGDHKKALEGDAFFLMVQGAYHSLCEATGVRARLDCPSGEVMNSFLNGYASHVDFAEKWNLVGQAARVGKPVFVVISDEFWKDDRPVEAAIRYVKSQLNNWLPADCFSVEASWDRKAWMAGLHKDGFASLSGVRVDQGLSLNSMVFVRESLLPALKRYADKHGMVSYLHCKGMPDC
jgi:hypothetical protein